MEKVYVRDLSENEGFHSLFLAKEKALHTGKNGKQYMSLLLSDKSGTVDARVWDKVEETDRLFQAGEIIRVKGIVQVFQNRKQVIVHKIERHEHTDLKIEDYVAESDRDPADLLQELIGIVQLVHDSRIRQLLMDTLTDPQIRPRLLKSPAAKSIHHAKVGGLLEHVISICGVMRFMASHYKMLNLDLLIFGAIYHDIGKIWELDVTDGITYTDEGRLIGHLVMSVELIEKKASRILAFPEPLKVILKHIVLSHHGRLEFGSPKRPKFLEAFVVAMIDDLDSKIDTIHSIITNESQGESWTRYSGLFDRYFYTDAQKELEKKPENPAPPKENA